METPLDKKIKHNDSKHNESVTYESSSEQKPPVINIATSEDDTSIKRQRKQKKSSKMLTPEEEQNYRSYRERKLRKLIDRCRKEKIVFSQKYCDLSVVFSETPHKLSFAQLEMLRCECVEALDTDTDSSHNSDSSQEPPQKKKKVGLLAPSKPRKDPTNPYNPAWASTQNFKFSTQGPGQFMHQRMAGSARGRGVTSFRFGAPPCTPPNPLYASANFSPGTQFPSPEYMPPGQYSFSYYPQHMQIAEQQPPQNVQGGASRNVEQALPPPNQHLLPVQQILFPVHNQQQQQQQVSQLTPQQQSVSQTQYHHQQQQQLPSAEPDSPSFPAQDSSLVSSTPASTETYVRDGL